MRKRRRSLVIEDDPVLPLCYWQYLLTKGVLLLVSILFWVPGCAVNRSIEKTTDDIYVLNYVRDPQIGDYRDIDRKSLRQAILSNLSYLYRLDEDTVFNYGGRTVSVKEVIRSQKTFLQVIDHAVSEEMLEILMSAMFEWYRASGRDGRGTVIFTGYYIPEIEGSLYPSERYRYPIYRTPEDLKKKTPFYTREEIDGNRVLDGKGLEIAWLADPIEAYFLHIQGSGIIKLPDGSSTGVHYAGNNGHPYRSIGKIMIEKGLIKPEEGSLEGIKRYFKDHPEKIAEVLYQNPRYIFFEIDKSPAVGGLDVPLTAGHSIATDPTFFPKGGLSYIKTRIPIVDPYGVVKGWTDIGRFVVNQDEGGAIKGPDRVDIFWGTGFEAGLVAGSMKEKGYLYFLLQK